MKVTTLTAIFLISFNSYAEMNVTSSISPNNVTERCFYPETVLDFTVDKKQIKNFEKLCSIDPYSISTANDTKSAFMCPKLVSSSPGLYFIENVGHLEKSQFKSLVCSGRRPLKTAGNDEYKKLAKFKNSLGFTKAHASVVYNYLSKMVFQNLTIPEAVFRSMDYIEMKKETSMAMAQIQKLQIPKSQIIVDSWTWLNQLYSNKKIPDQLKYDDQSILGILIKDFKAVQYVELAAGPSTETTQEKNSVYQNVFFEKPIIKSYLQIQKNEIQNLIEAQGISEMLVLDTLLSQRDRYGSYGNIHYVPAWTKAMANNFEFEKATLDESEQRVLPSEVKEKTAQGFILVKKIALIDNDGAIKNAEQNSNKKRNVISRLRHFSQQTYFKIMKLNQQFEDTKNIENFENSFLLQESEMKAIVTNLKEISATLKANCKNGFLKLDLNTEDIAAQKTNGNICE